MQTRAITVDRASAAPDRRLAPFVGRYLGYRYDGLDPGSHLGLPSPDLTVVVSLGPPTRLSRMPDPSARPAEFDALVGGLHLRPAVISHDGELCGVQLAITPLGARALLGVPAAELAHAVVDLGHLLGPDADELLERMREAAAWPARFAILDEVLGRRIDRHEPGVSPLERAWSLIVWSGGAIRVARLADEVGWSRRHLNARFAAEFGLTPKELARVARFDRSSRLLRREPELTMAAAAADCGYYDQAHMAREWNALAGCPPSQWRSDEELPFVQDAGGAAVSPLGHEHDH